MKYTETDHNIFHCAGINRTSFLRKRLQISGKKTQWKEKKNAEREIGSEDRDEKERDLSKIRPEECRKRH